LGTQNAERATDAAADHAGARHAGAAAKGIVIVGTDGAGREAHQYVLDTLGGDPGYYVKGFLDDSPTELEPFGIEEPLLGNTFDYQPDADDRIVIACGNPQNRKQMASRLASRGATFLTVIHPRAYVAPTARIGAGCILAPYSTVGARATLGDHCVLWFYASVGHDATVGDCCRFSPFAVTNGGSVLEEGVFLGAHAVVNPDQVVGAGSRVAAGSVVYRRVPAGSFVTGNPAKARSQWRW